MTNSDKIEIRNGKIKSTDYIYIGFSLIMLILSLNENDRMFKIIGIILFGCLSIYFIYLMISRIRDNSIKYIIDETGFKLLNENMMVPWTMISEVIIERGKSNFIDFFIDYLTLTVETKISIQTISISLEELNLNKKQVIDYCEYQIDIHFDRISNTYCG